MITAVNNGQGWKTWTPTWTSTGTAPTGWSLRTSESNIYRRDGDLIRCKINMWTSGGSGVGGGSGIWTMALPVKPRTNGVSKVTIGSWRYFFSETTTGQVQGHIVTLLATQTDSKVAFATVRADSDALMWLGPGSLSAYPTLPSMSYIGTNLMFWAELFYEAY